MNNVEIVPLIANSNSNRKINVVDDAAVDMNFELSGVIFSSHGNDSFRVQSELAEEGLILKLEKKSTKQRWQAIIVDIGNHGPSGIPKEVVVSIMKKYFQESALMESYVVDPTKPVMDLPITSEGCVLILEVPFGGHIVTYNFDLIPLAVDEYEKLEGSLKDALDEIFALKKVIFVMSAEIMTLMKTRISVCVFRASKSATRGHAFCWDKSVVNSSTTCFRLPPPHNTLIVTDAGSYEICVTVETSCHSTPTGEVCFYLNDRWVLGTKAEKDQFGGRFLYQIKTIQNLPINASLKFVNETNDDFNDYLNDYLFADFSVRKVD